MENLIRQYVEVISTTLELSREEAIEFLADPDWELLDTDSLDVIEKENVSHAVGWLQGVADTLHLTTREVVENFLEGDSTLSEPL